VVITVVVALGTTLLVGSAAAAPRKAPAAAAPKAGGSLVYGLEAESGGGWCPTSERLAASGIMVESAIYDTLMAPNDKNVMKPYLAKTASSSTTARPSTPTR
jgi:peptide/nickel transport system substrate-binding protein